MKLHALDIKKLRKKSIQKIRELLHQYRIPYAMTDNKETLLGKIQEIQKFSQMIKHYSQIEQSNLQMTI